MIWVIILQYCAACEYSKEFTECSQGTMAVVVTPSNCTDNSISVIPGLSCTIQCPAGAFLDYDLDTNSLACSLCKAGTFSIGGGTRISSWTSLSMLNFQSYCWVMQSKGWVMNTDCWGWHTNSEAALVSGSASVNQWYETDLIFYPLIVKSGSLKVTYRKETSSLDGWSLGDFYIFLDDDLVYFDYDSDAPHWVTATVPLSLGLHSIQLVFDKFVTDQVSEVQIKEIQIRGTEYSSTFCEACTIGYSAGGSDVCIVCDIGSYLNGTQCSSCPPGFSSSPGSLSQTDCFALQACTEEGYGYMYSPCESGWMEKVYQWNDPLLCDNTGLSLPSNENLQCIACPAGMYYEAQTCTACPTGTFILESGYGQVCTGCAIGSYAPKLSEYTQWADLPLEFHSFCVSATMTSCTFAWEPRGSYITTSPVYIPFSQIGLSIKTLISEEDSFVEYYYSVKGAYVKFSFYIDGVEVNTTVGEGERHYLEYVSAGSHSFKWVCYHLDYKDESCRITEIRITGTADGGSNSCIPCRTGYFSDVSTDYCTACQSGFTSSSDLTSCVACLGSTYSNQPGPCRTCPDGTIPNTNHTECVVGSTITISNSTFLSGNLTGVDGNIPDYCKLDRFKIYCYQTFYGPTPGNNSYFYLSVLNPSFVSMPSYVQASDMDSYAFGVIDMDQLTVFEQQILKPNDTCGEDYSRIIVNLGSEVGSVTKTDAGFNTSYINGDRCTPEENFSVNIMFECNKFELEGWPTYLETRGCRHEFYWPTVHACEVCTDSMLVPSQGVCSHGKKYTYLFEGPYCIMGNGETFKTVVDNCNHNHVFKTAPFIFSMALVFVMLLIVGLTIFCACRTRNKYKRLIQYKSDGRNIEMAAQ